MPALPPSFDLQILDQLACPVCFGNLAIVPSAQRIQCISCGRTYPLIDGTPILIPDRAAISETKA